MAEFQQVLLRDLPLSAGTAAPYTFVAVDGNRNSVRVPSSVLTEASVKLDSTAPASLTAPGSEGSIAFSCPSLYSYYNGQWGASPRYTKNLGDLDPNTRFLLVNKTMALTATEQSNVKSALGIGIATTNTAGLVFGSAPEKEGMATVTVEEGRLYVRDATATDKGVVTTTGEEGPVTTKEYVDTQISGLNRELVIPVADTGKIGGVLSGGDGDIFTVAENGAVTIRQATAGTGIPGIVSIASENVDAQIDYVVPLRLMRTVVEEITAGTVAYASYTKAGIVKPAGTGEGADGKPYGALYFTDSAGTLDVAEATDEKYGVVLTTSSISSSTSATTVPNTGAVRNYVQSVLSSGEGEGGGGGVVISPSSLPIATTSARGAVVVGSTLSISSSGVLSVRQATLWSAGAVQLSDSLSRNSNLTAATSSTVYTLASRVAVLESEVAKLKS